MASEFIATYYIGTNDKDTHTREYSMYEFSRIINNVLLRNDIDDYTTSDCVGHYKGEIENTKKIELVDRKIPKEVLEQLKTILNQECILEVITPCNYNFI